MERSPADHGSALIIVLWVIALLGMLVSSLAFDAHIEARITSYYRKRTKAEHLARSGLDVAQMLMVKSSGMSRDAEDDADDRWFGDAKQLKDMDAVSVTEKLGDGTVTVNIVPEEARRNVNRLTEQDWERILEVGDIDEEMWPELIESFQDWFDKDNDSRVDGAEKDYYGALDPPYQPRNGPLDTVDELLLVKGFDRTVLKGGVIKTELGDDETTRISGIGDLLTTYGSKVNVNAASSRVLMTLPGVDELVAGAIIEEREGWVDEEEGERDENPFENFGDLFSRIPELDQSVQKRQLVTFNSNIFRITSIGNVGGVTRKVWCIGEYMSKPKSIKILRWREEN